jgi:ketosteroid isomerase-like protein
MSHSIVGDAGDMAYMVIKTRPAAGKAERYHTVVFVKTPDGTWKISAWHAGS